MIKPTLSIAVYQFDPRLRALAENRDALRAAGERTASRLLVSPELSLTGYDVRDAAAELAQPAASLAGLVRPDSDRALIVGFIELGNDALLYNAAALVTPTTTAVHRKIYLPTYGMFDEGRYFARGDRLTVFELDGWRLGILICEDFWHPALAYILACRGLDLLIVPAAAAGRGVWEGGEHDSPFASMDVWERIARTTAQLYGMFVVLCNRVGVEGAVTFGGCSLVAGPTGDVLARAAEPREQLLELTLDPAELTRARRPFAHLRDDDPHLTLRELVRALDARWPTAATASC